MRYVAMRAYDVFVNSEKFERHISVKAARGFVCGRCAPNRRPCRRKIGGGNGDRIMPSYDPELIQIMRAALDQVMTKIPLDQVTPGIKAHMAEVILKAAAEGQTSYDGLLAVASDQIQTIVAMMT
jgi:hypothetical protein